MSKIYLVRHGATEWNHSRRAQGHADIDLGTEGYKQAVGAARELAKTDLAAVYSSDLKRAVRTAEPIAREHGLEVIQDPDLREIDQGEWEGLHVDEIKKRWPDLWGAARHYSRRPGGESPEEVRRRAVAALTRIVERYPDGDVAVVSHGGTIRTMSAEVLGYDERAAARLRGLGNGQIVYLEAHLEDGALALDNFERWDGQLPDLDDPND
jgi:broad specificity phosphatase PhoE